MSTPLERFDEWREDNRDVMAQLYADAEKIYYLSRAEVDVKIMNLRGWLNGAKGSKVKYHDWKQFIWRNMQDRPFKGNRAKPSRVRGSTGKVTFS